MTLISQPGSDYQIAQITLDAGHARDIMLLLIDARAVLEHLRGGPAEAPPQESGSPYTLPALIQALDDVAVQLSHAERQAFTGIPRTTPGHRPGGPAAGRDPVQGSF